MTMWYDNAVEILEKSLDNEEITYEEFRAEMKDLNEELEQSAHDAAEEAYKDIMGQW